MKRWLVLALLAVMGAAGCASKSDPPLPIRAMTHNIRLENEADGANAWPFRRESESA